MRSELGWKNNWELFVKSVGASFDQGLDDEAVTDLYAGQSVEWTGTIAEIRLDDRPGIQLNMPLVEVERANGQAARVDYLFLRLKDSDVEFWRHVVLGTTLRFTTQIRRAVGPFPGVRWSDLEDRRGIIMFATDGGRPIGESSV